MLGLLVPLFFIADWVSLYFAWTFLRPDYGGWLAAGVVALYVVVVIVLGGWVVRLGGLFAGLNAVRALRRGENPTRELVNGILALVAGLLLIEPGILSDVLAVLLLLPPTRALVRGAILRRARARRPEPDGSDVPYRID